MNRLETWKKQGTRFITCPEDYPPSEWRAYKQVTADIQEIRGQLSELYNRI